MGKPGLKPSSVASEPVPLSQSYPDTCVCLPTLHGRKLRPQLCPWVLLLLQLSLTIVRCVLMDLCAFINISMYKCMYVNIMFPAPLQPIYRLCPGCFCQGCLPGSEVVSLLNVFRHTDSLSSYFILVLGFYEIPL